MNRTQHIGARRVAALLVAGALGFGGIAGASAGIALIVEAGPVISTAPVWRRSRLSVRPLPESFNPAMSTAGNSSYPCAPSTTEVAENVALIGNCRVQVISRIVTGP